MCKNTRNVCLHIAGRAGGGRGAAVACTSPWELELELDAQMQRSFLLGGRPKNDAIVTLLVA